MKPANFLKILLITAAFIVFSCNAYSLRYVSSDLYSSKRNPQRFEIDQLNFKGNKTFDRSELLPVLSLSGSSRSIPHSILEYYYNSISRIPMVPEKIDSTLLYSLKQLENEISYFNENIAVNDSVALWHFYNINGFHFADIDFTFKPDTNSGKNILTFHIEENKRFFLDTVNYIGIDSLPENIIRKINKSRSLKSGKKFYEPEIINEANKVYNILLNNGYYHAKMDMPFISIDTTSGTDSVTVKIDPGPRKKIGHITYVDSTMGQHIVVEELKNKQVALEEGDWYSREDLKKSERNLNALGTFELVMIDTSSQFYPQTDSTLNLKIYLQYRRQREWDAGMFMNQTPFYNYVNLGFSGSIYHRNIFGAAQSFNFFTNMQINDVSKIISDVSNLETEGQIGVQYSQPILWVLDNSKVSLRSSFIFSAKQIENFRLHTWSFPVKFPITLPKITYFNQLVLDFSFERQEPVELPTLSSVSDSRNRNLYRAVYLYRDLNNYLNESRTNLLTSNLIGLTLIGDNKNHPFSPTNGSYTYISADGWNVFLAHPTISGLSRFFRFQFARSDFFSWNQLAVHALKVKLGGIYLLNPENSYVPIERQFFAGGSNSVRGWQSRKLHYTDVYSQQGDTSISKDDYDLLSNIVGSGGLIEFSYEFRYKFPKPDWADATVGEQISNLGMTFFLDVGNAFHWFAEEKTEVKFSDYLTELAWATGAGLRYETPIGPLRIDFGLPLYGPVYGKADNILKRRNILSDIQIHFGIGHAF